MAGKPVAPWMQVLMVMLCLWRWSSCHAALVKTDEARTQASPYVLLPPSSSASGSQDHYSSLHVQHNPHPDRGRQDPFPDMPPSVPEQVSLKTGVDEWPHDLGRFMMRSGQSPGSKALDVLAGSDDVAAQVFEKDGEEKQQGAHQTFDFGVSKRQVDPNNFKFGLGKRAVDSYNFKFGLGKRQQDPRHPNSVLGKRKVDHNNFSFGLGKRRMDQNNFKFGLGKRNIDRNSFSFGLGKRGVDRNNFGFGLGKRKMDSNNFGFGLGKRKMDSNNFGFGLGKRKMDSNNFGFGLGKRKMDRNNFGFGLGKRKMDGNDFSFGLDKRKTGLSNLRFGQSKRKMDHNNFGFGLGKRKTDISNFSYGLDKRFFNDLKFGQGKGKLYKRNFHVGLGKRGEMPELSAILTLYASRNSLQPKLNLANMEDPYLSSLWKGYPHPSQMGQTLRESDHFPPTQVPRGGQGLFMKISPWQEWRSFLESEQALPGLREANDLQ